MKTDQMFTANPDPDGLTRGNKQLTRTRKTPLCSRITLHRIASHRIATIIPQSHKLFMIEELICWR